MEAIHRQSRNPTRLLLTCKPVEGRPFIALPLPLLLLPPNLLSLFKWYPLSPIICSSSMFLRVCKDLVFLCANYHLLTRYFCDNNALQNCGTTSNAFMSEHTYVHAPSKQVTNRGKRKRMNVVVVLCVYRGVHAEDLPSYLCYYFVSLYELSNVYTIAFRVLVLRGY